MSMAIKGSFSAPWGTSVFWKSRGISVGVWDAFYSIKVSSFPFLTHIHTHIYKYIYTQVQVTLFQTSRSTSTENNDLCHSGYDAVPPVSLPDNITLPLFSFRTKAAYSLPVQQGPLLTQCPHNIISGCNL